MHDVLVQLNRPLSQTLGKKRVIKTLERTDVSRSKKDHFIGLSQASMFWFFFLRCTSHTIFLSAPRVTLLRKFFKTKRTQGLTNHLTRWVSHRFFRKKLRVYVILLIVFDMFRILTGTDVSRSKKDHFIGLSQASMFWFFFLRCTSHTIFLSAPRVTLLRKFFKTKRTQGLTNHLTRWVSHRFFRKKLRVYVILLIVFDMFRILTARLFV